MMRAFIASAIAAIFAFPAVQAQSAHTLSGNVTLVGDYRFRGLSQTYTQPAIQGGVDYAGRPGFRNAVLLVSPRALQHRSG